MTSVARILGARQPLQALFTARRPTRRVLEVGAAVDALHAATMVLGAAAKLANFGSWSVVALPRRPRYRAGRLLGGKTHLKGKRHQG
jgi:hypothetical protein